MCVTYRGYQHRKPECLDDAAAGPISSTFKHMLRGSDENRDKFLGRMTPPGRHAYDPNHVSVDVTPASSNDVHAAGCLRTATTTSPMWAGRPAQTTSAARPAARGTPSGWRPPTRELGKCGLLPTSPLPRPPTHTRLGASLEPRATSTCLRPPAAPQASALQPRYAVCTRTRSSSSASI